MELILSTPCSRSGLLSAQGVALVHLDYFPHHNFLIWTKSSVLFPLSNESSGVLASCSLCGSTATLFYSTSQMCLACATLQPLCWYRQHHQDCRFPFSQTLALSLLHFPLYRPSFYFILFGRNYSFFPSPSTLLLGCNGSPVIHFSQVITQMMSWPGGVGFCSHPLSHIVFLLLPLVSSLFFSWTGGALFYQNSLTFKFPQYRPRDTCFLVMLVVSSLVFTATDTAFC